MWKQNDQQLLAMAATWTLCGQRQIPPVQRVEVAGRGREVLAGGLYLWKQDAGLKGPWAHSAGSVLKVMKWRSFKLHLTKTKQNDF